MKEIIKINYLLDENDRNEILNALKSRKKSMRDLASQVGVSVSYLSTCFRGNKQISSRLLYQICDVAGIQLVGDKIKAYEYSN